jgi:hypothetical protein
MLQWQQFVHTVGLYPVPHLFHVNLIGGLLPWILAGRVAEMEQGTSLLENAVESGHGRVILK